MNVSTSTFLYPRLLQAVAMLLVKDRAARTIDELVGLSDIQHAAATYGPTGGTRVPDEHLARLQTLIRKAAQIGGYPEQAGDKSRRAFDATSGKLLYETMGIAPTEGSRPGVWAFLGCVLLPDIVRWRFPGAGGSTSPERFLGRARGLRNTFGRVWWRAHILRLPDDAKSYDLLERLGEDELVQIMERPNLAASPVLARQAAMALLRTAEQHSSVARSELLRDAMKRLRRLLRIVSFDAIDEHILADLVDELFQKAAVSLGSGEIEAILPPATAGVSARNEGPIQVTE